MILTPQLVKKAMKNRASHASSIREPKIDFRKLLGKLEQAEVTINQKKNFFKTTICKQRSNYKLTH